MINKAANVSQKYVYYQENEQKKKNPKQLASGKVSSLV